jgi:hypothetical protein
MAPKNHFWLDTRLDMSENQPSSGVGVIVAVVETEVDVDGKAGLFASPSADP